MNVPNLKEIAVAWWRSFQGTPEQTAIAQERLETCDGCPAKKYQELIRTFVCSDCGCPLNKKVFSPLPGDEACPRKKWQR